LRIAYKDSCSHSEELLTKANTVPIHHKNLQWLAIEICKTQKNPTPTLVNKVFAEKDTLYICRSGKNILVTKPSTRCGIENARFLGAKVWRIIPSSLTESQTLKSFKKALKTISLIATVDFVKDLSNISGFYDCRYIFDDRFYACK